MTTQNMQENYLLLLLINCRDYNSNNVILTYAHYLMRTIKKEQDSQSAKQLTTQVPQHPYNALQVFETLYKEHVEFEHVTID